MQSLGVVKMISWHAVSTFRPLSSYGDSVFFGDIIPNIVVNRFCYTGSFQRFRWTNPIHCLYRGDYSFVHLLFYALPPTNFWVLLKALPPSSRGPGGRFSVGCRVLRLRVLLGFRQANVRWSVVIYCHVERSWISRLFTRIYTSYLIK